MTAATPRRAYVISQDMATFQALWRKYGGAQLGLTESNPDFIRQCFMEFAQQQALDKKYNRLMATMTITWKHRGGRPGASDLPSAGRLHLGASSPVMGSHE